MLQACHLNPPLIDKIPIFCYLTTFIRCPILRISKALLPKIGPRKLEYYTVKRLLGSILLLEEQLWRVIVKKLLKTISDTLREFLNSILGGVVEGVAGGVIMGGTAAHQPPQVVVVGGGNAYRAAVLPAPQQPPAAPPVANATPLNVAAAGALNAATAAATNIGGQLTHGAGQLAAQVGPAAQRLGRGIADAVDDAWVPPAIALFIFYTMYMVGLLLLLPDAHHRILWISSRASAVTHGWYTIAFCLHIMAILVVMVLAAIAVAFPTPGDRLHFRVTRVGTVIMLITIPLAPLAMGSAIGSAIHSARLAEVPLRYLPDLYAAGNALMVIGVIVASLYYGALYGIVNVIDAAADAVSDDDVPFQKIQEWLGKWGGLFLTILVVRFTAMTSFPSPQLTDDFLIFGLVLLTTGLLVFKAAKIEVKIETWQKVAVTYLIIIIGATVWTWLKTRHGLEVDQVTNQLSAQRGQLERIWDIWTNDLVVNAGLLKKHGADYGFVIGLVKGGVFSALGTFFLWATGVSWGQAKGAHWRKIVFVPIFLGMLIATLAMLISDLSIVVGWLSRLH